MKVTSTCPKCSVQSEWKYPEEAYCTCSVKRVQFATDAFLNDETLNQCPLCGCAHVYRQKDFNRRIGVALIILGVALAYFTYGISLVAVTAVDWILNRIVGEVGICYQCHAQFRKSSAIPRLETFNLSLFDYYNNLSQA